MKNISVIININYPILDMYMTAFINITSRFHLADAWPQNKNIVSFDRSFPDD